MNEKEMTDCVSGAVCYEEEITMAYKREEANETAAAKETLESNDAISKEDVEIRRLIEERRNTPKGETTMERSEQTKNASGTKKRAKRQEIQRMLEDFKGIRRIPGIKSARRRVLITKMRTRKAKSLHQGRELPMSFGKSTKHNTMTKNTKKLNRNMKRMKLKEASMCTTGTRMR